MPSSNIKVEVLELVQVSCCGQKIRYRFSSLWEIFVASAGSQPAHGFPSMGRDRRRPSLHVGWYMYLGIVNVAKSSKEGCRCT